MMPLPALRAWLRRVPHPSRHFSQAEEDAVLDALLFELKLPSGLFVEIGVGPGTENNTRALAERGWRGIWVGDEPIVFVPEGVYPIQETVTAENIDDLIGDLPAIRIDVFSLDIDGNDYWIAERAIPRLSPTVVIVEYCHIAPPGWIMPYTPGYRWHQGELCGASLAAWQRALSAYVLVYTTQAQVNAIFVHRRVWAVDAIAVHGGGVPMDDLLQQLISELRTLREGVERNEQRLSAEQISNALTRLEGLATEVQRLAAEPPASVIDTDDAGSKADAEQLAAASDIQAIQDIVDAPVSTPPLENVLAVPPVTPPSSEPV